ncbi:MAG: gamma-glutamyltransferase [Gammaproteobacteria bacterium]|nr:gamma-glutamyltransferase [Gammaproteobacteria bacterium]MDH4255694.1 gamma-glutamyltransferase [Gammaproteobacteria bacterium]
MRRPAWPGLLLVFLTLASASADEPTYANGVVASAHPVATEAGLSVLRSGGNAFDAAVAVAATLNVVEPMMSGMGGYGTIMVYAAADGAPLYLDASGKIPAGVDPDAYRAPTPNYKENRVGAKAVSTPGATHAWEAMHTRYGTRPWAELLQPAIRAAEDGFVLDERIAGFIADAYGEFPDHARSIFGRDGVPLPAGERLVQRELANTLRILAKQGPAAIYGGELGKAIDDAMQSAGGFLAMADLEAHVAEWWTPLHLEYRGHDVYTPSAPAGAFPMLERLGMMDLAASRGMGHNSLAYLHTFAEITKMAYWDRLAYSGDPDVQPPPYERLLSRDYWQQRVDSIDPQRARDFDYSGIVSANSANTTHFVVADKWGNVVSAQVTLGGLFGAKIMPAGTGFWLNNSLRYCTFEPAGNPMDAHPGRRKLSSDAPAIIFRDGRPVIAIGTPGGHTITQAIAQMIMNMLDHGMSVNDAIAAPRIAFLEPNTLIVEEAIPQAIRDRLAAMGHQLQVGTIGNANGLAIEYGEDGSPRFTGATDPRGAGLASGL